MSHALHIPGRTEVLEASSTWSPDFSGKSVHFLVRMYDQSVDRCTVLCRRSELQRGGQRQTSWMQKGHCLRLSRSFRAPKGSETHS